MDNQYAPPAANVDDMNRANQSGLTSVMIEAMRGTKPWVLLIAIVLVLGAVFMVLATLGMMLAGAVGVAGGTESGMLLVVGITYGLMSVIYILMSIYLFKYSSAIGRLVQSASTSDMEDALTSQRKFWKLAGIITAIMIVLAVLGFLAALIVPFMMHA